MRVGEHKIVVAVKFHQLLELQAVAIQGRLVGHFLVLVLSQLRLKLRHIGLVEQAGLLAGARLFQLRLPQCDEFIVVHDGIL